MQFYGHMTVKDVFITQAPGGLDSWDQSRLRSIFLNPKRWTFWKCWDWDSQSRHDWDRSRPSCLRKCPLYFFYFPTYQLVSTHKNYFFWEPRIKFCIYVISQTLPGQEKKKLSQNKINLWKSLVGAPVTTLFLDDFNIYLSVSQSLCLSVSLSLCLSVSLSLCLSVSHTQL